MSGPEMSHAFVPARDQDAFASIRGFVYQVETTIARWIQLDASEALELERGEDIDRVCGYLRETASEGHSRVLEQVKHRTVAVTLRSEAALSAVCNAFQHRRANPDLSILFRYVSNARAGVERGRDTSLIELWESIRQQRIPDAAGEACRPIAQFLASLSRPSSIVADDWQLLQDCSASESQCLPGLIATFEWSLGNPGSESLRAQLIDDIKGTLAGGDEQAALSIYRRLFVDVFQLLTTAGIKRLRQRQLQDAVRDTHIRPVDEQLLRLLELSVEQNEARIASLEVAHSEVNERIQHLVTKLDMHVTRTSAEIPCLDPPDLPALLTQRQSTVEAISKSFRPGQWLALYGGEDDGKSTLAALIARSKGDLKAWIGIDASSSAANAQLTTALAALVERQPSNQLSELVRLAASHVGERGVLVIDGIPDLSADARFGQTLSQLVRALSSENGFLVTTGVYEPTAHFVPGLTSGVLQCLETPMLDESETAELLAAYGASGAVAQGIADRVRTQLKGHPLLIAAYAADLAAAEWKTDRELDPSVSEGRNLRSLKSEVARRMLQSLSDSMCDVLLRAGVSRHPLRLPEIDAVGEVVPAIERARLQFCKMLGPWVREPRPGLYEVSPLVNEVTDQLLSDDLRRRCMIALANWVVRQESVTEQMLIRAIGFYISAGEFDRGGTLFLMALASIPGDGTAAAGQGILSLWENVPLPPQIDASIRLLARGKQFLARSERGLERGFVLHDFDVLVEQLSSTDAGAVASACAYAVIATASSDVSASLRYLRVALQQERLLANGALTNKEPAVKLNATRLLLTPLPHVGTDTIEQWLSVVQDSPLSERTSLFATRVAHVGLGILQDRIATGFGNASNEQFDWRRYDELVAKWAEQSRAVSCDVIASAFERARLRVRAERFNDFASVKQLCLQASKYDTAAARSFVRCAGVFALHSKDLFELARVWFNQAIADVDSFHWTDPIFLRLVGCELFESSDAAQARNYLVEAEQLASVSELMTDADRATIAVMRAYFEFRNGQIADAAALLIRAVRAFDHARDGSVEWRAAMAAATLVVKLMHSVIFTGAPPEEQAGEPWRDPTYKMLFSRSRAAAEYGGEAAWAAILLFAGLIADSVHLDDDAEALIHAARAVSVDSPELQHSTGNRLVLSWLRAGDYGSAVRHSVRFGMAIVEYQRRSSLPIGNHSLSEYVFIECLFPFTVEAFSRELAGEGIDHSLQAMESELHAIVGTVSDPTVHLAADGFSSILRSSDDCARLNVIAGQCGGRACFAVARLFQSRVGTVADSLFGHISAFYTMQSETQADNSLWRRLYAPFLLAYWKQRRDEEAMMFRSPQLLERELNAIDPAEGINAARRTFNAVRQAVPIRGIPDNALAWLNAPSISRAIREPPPYQNELTE